MNGKTAWKINSSMIFLVPKKWSIRLRIITMQKTTAQQPRWGDTTMLTAKYMSLRVRVNEKTIHSETFNRARTVSWSAIVIIVNVSFYSQSRISCTIKVSWDDSDARNCCCQYWDAFSFRRKIKYSHTRIIRYNNVELCYIRRAITTSTDRSVHDDKRGRFKIDLCVRSESDVPVPRKKGFFVFDI